LLDKCDLENCEATYLVSHKKQLTVYHAGLGRDIKFSFFANKMNDRELQKFTNLAEQKKPLGNYQHGSHIFSMKDLYFRKPSMFRGVVDLNTEDGAIYAWNLVEKNIYKLNKKNKVEKLLHGKEKKELILGRLGFFEIHESIKTDEGLFHSISEIKDYWVKADDELIYLRPSLFTNRKGKNLFIDLSKNIVVATNENKIEFTTLISPGTEEFPSPDGVHRAVRKTDIKPMIGGATVDTYYEVHEVPWTINIKGNYAIHGTYWHSNFGKKMSHGCVNLSLTDAKFVYNWVDEYTNIITY